MVLTNIVLGNYHYFYFIGCNHSKMLYKTFNRSKELTFIDVIQIILVITLEQYWIMFLWLLLSHTSEHKMIHDEVEDKYIDSSNYKYVRYNGDVYAVNGFYLWNSDSDKAIFSQKDIVLLLPTTTVDESLVYNVK